jgi:hypothetical protein
LYEREGAELGKGEEKGENLKMSDRKFKEVVEREKVMVQRKWSRRNENEDSYKERFQG